MDAPCLSKIVTTVLALSTSGCFVIGATCFLSAACPEDVPWTVSLSEVLSGDLLEEVRANSSDPDQRCKAACVELAHQHDRRNFNAGDVTRCEAVPSAGAADDAAWDPIHTELTITCTAEGVETPFCTGRRPLGHREAELAVDGLGAWFAVHAHLEQASIAAFEQLGRWLHDRGAPPSLVERCRAARLDEIDHARRMTEQAHRHGAAVPMVSADAHPEDLLAVAVHNAVEGCVFEAFAALLAAHQATNVEDPELRELFEILAADELRHGQLAWDIHGWLLTRLSPTERDCVDRALSEAFARLPELAYQGAATTPVGLGWPEKQAAEQMARLFAEHIRDVRAAA